MSGTDARSRPPLTRDRVLRAAVDLADRGGLGDLTMRRLGAELGVEAMALYRHVENKEEILDGIVDLVVGEIEIPVDGEDWRGAMRRRATSARAVFARHSWAIGLLEARGSRGASSLRYLDAILGNLRSAGFSVEDAAHAFWLLDSYVYGHVVQEMSLRRDPSGETAGWGEVGLEGHPHLLEAAEHAGRGGASVDREFAFGLELILDALGERLAGEDR